MPKLCKNGNPLIISYRYKIAAKVLAQTNGLKLDKKFENNLDKLFNTKDIHLGLKKEFKGKVIWTTTKVTSLVAAVWVGISGLAGFTNATITGATAAEKSSDSSIVGENQSYNTNQYSDAIQETINIQDSTESILETDTQNISSDPASLPISANSKINTYADAGKDFMQKLGEIYEYNTGKKPDINLSSLGLKNIGYAQTTIYKVTIGDQVYRFSSMSTYPSNNMYLEQVLNTIEGAEVTKYTGDIAYISQDGETSNAICDSFGNPVKSGNILGPGEIYNQSYLNWSRNNGYDTSSLSDSALMAYYLMNNNAQDPELSKALGYLVPLAKQIDETFLTEKSDSYTVQLYASMAQEIADDFNSSTMSQGSQTYDDSYDLDTNSDYDYDDER